MLSLRAHEHEAREGERRKDWPPWSRDAARSVPEDLHVKMLDIEMVILHAIEMFVEVARSMSLNVVCKASSRLQPEPWRCQGRAQTGNKLRSRLIHNFFTISTS